MKSVRQWLVQAAMLTVMAVTPAFAQGTTTSSITGTVVDSGGGVIPGAAVVATSAAGGKFNAVTSTEGVFTIPALTPGVYKVTVTLQGFKTAITDNVRVVSGSPASIKVTLEVGALTESVTVKSSAELINTQTATVAATLNSDQLNRMPTPTRNALNAVTFLPGVNTTGVNRDATVNGLPQSMLNITLDGVSNNDNFLKSTDGFFASVTPRQDAVEAVTVTLAVAEANLGGSGAVTINFTTRSGTNRFSGGVYEYWRDPRLNTNYWFNERNGLPKNDVKLNQYGVRVGGPIKIPGVYDGSGKAFYFFNYEQLRFPNSFTRTRSAWNPTVLDGNFIYNTGTTTAPNLRTVNVMALAAANGQIATYDPQVRTLLNNINSAIPTTGTLSATSDPMVNSYVWLSPGKLFEHQPTIRLDYNLSTKHRLGGSFQEIFAERDPDYLNGADARFPGAPNYRVFSSSRPLYSMNLRSTLSASMVNEVRVGLTAIHGSSRFGQPADPSQGPGSFADIGGYAVVIPTTTDWWTVNTPSWRAAPTYSIAESLNWLRGSHSFNFGGEYQRTTAWEMAQQIVPGITLGFDNTNDPARGMFNTTNFPSASTTQLASARAMYAMLTGRVSAVTGQAALDPATNQYVDFGPRRREGELNTYSLYASDSWRLKPTVTLNLGVRWDLQKPYMPINDTSSAVTLEDICGISGVGDGSTYNKCAFGSRTNSGYQTQFIQLKKGTGGYETDWNNIAPNVSIAWRPNVQDGFLRTLLGDPEQATVRAGYSQTYERQGISTFTGAYGTNPGATLALNRNASTGLVPAGEAWPILYSEKNRLYQQSHPDAPTYPILPRANRADSYAGFAPDIVIASARSYTVSFQRSIGKDMAVDIRYVGTQGIDQWSTLNYNTRDLERNGFYNEFLQAVNNLKVNNASGDPNRKGSFKYFGAGTGTNPLPIYLAYLSGSTDTTNVAAYTGTDWTSTGITQDMIFVNASPGNGAADLDGDLTRRTRAATVGIPSNFFVLNPAVTTGNVTDAGAYSDYNALQIDLRRRLAQGLSFSVNYQYATEGGSAFDGFYYGRAMAQTANVRHAIKTQWDWTIPVGRGQRYGTDMNALLDGAIGGWSFRGVGRIQARMMNMGNVRLVGMTQKDLQKMYKFDIRTDPASGLKTAYMLPDDVINATRAAFSLDPSTVNGYSATLGAPQGPHIAPANYDGCVQLKAGDCAPRDLLLRAPWFTRFDIGISKQFRLKGSANIEVAYEILNVLDNINFNPVANPGAGATIFQVTSAYIDASNTYDPGGRLGQVMFRFNW